MAQRIGCCSYVLTKSADSHLLVGTCLLAVPDLYRPLLLQNTFPQPHDTRSKSHFNHSDIQTACCKHSFILIVLIQAQQPYSIPLGMSSEPSDFTQIIAGTLTAICISSVFNSASLLCWNGTTVFEVAWIVAVLKMVTLLTSWPLLPLPGTSVGHSTHLSLTCCVQGLIQHF